MDRDVSKRQSMGDNTVPLTLAAEEKLELEKMIVQDKEALQVLRNTLTVYNQFRAEIATLRAEEEKKETGKNLEMLATATEIEAELNKFYSGTPMVEHMNLVNDVLAILKGSRQTELT